MTTGTDGWELSKTSVRDLMAEADLHADEAGGDFASESYRLGVAVAEVHADLARAFGTGELTPAERASTRGREMHAAPRPRAAGRPRSGRGRGRAAARVRRVRRLADRAASTQRIHGDLHLGQALRTVHRWVLLDFEGEPASSIAAAPAVRLAAARHRRHAALLRLRGPLPGAEHARARRSWSTGPRSGPSATATRSATATPKAAGHDPREDMAAIRGFEADKAVYEAMYEARNRPRWLTRAARVRCRGWSAPATEPRPPRGATVTTANRRPDRAPPAPSQPDAAEPRRSTRPASTRRNSTGWSAARTTTRTRSSASTRCRAGAP